MFIWEDEKKFEKLLPKRKKCDTIEKMIQLCKIKYIFTPKVRMTK